MAFIASDLQGTDLPVALRALKADFAVVQRRYVPTVLSAAVSLRNHTKVPTLTNREKLVLQGTAERGSDITIAARLGLSPRTIQKAYGERS